VPDLRHVGASEDQTDGGEEDDEEFEDERWMRAVGGVGEGCASATATRHRFAIFRVEIV